MLTYLALGFATSKDIYGFIRAHLPGRKKVPQDFVLADSHFHLDRRLIKNDDDICQIINAFFDAGIGWQTISDYELFIPSNHVISYEEFICNLKLKKRPNINISFSDGYATVVNRGDDRIIFTNGTEIETILEGSQPGLLRENHQIHISVEGLDRPRPGGTNHVLETAIRQNAFVTIAHPFTIPAGKTKIPLLKQITAFLPASFDEQNQILQLVKKFPQVYLEALNSGNSLWMTPTNSAVYVFARKHGMQMVYNTDAHTRPCPQFLQNLGFSKFWLLKQQIGSAGTLIPKRTIEDLSSLTGKEIIAKKYEAISSEGTRYGGVTNTWIFGLSVASTHLEYD